MCAQIVDSTALRVYNYDHKPFANFQIVGCICHQTGGKSVWVRSVNSSCFCLRKCDRHFSRVELVGIYACLTAGPVGKTRRVSTPPPTDRGRDNVLAAGLVLNWSCSMCFRSSLENQTDAISNKSAKYEPGRIIQYHL